MLEAVLAAALGWVLALHPAAAGAGTVDRAFPVLGDTSYAAAHHDYPATDVFAGCRRRAVSPVDGIVLELSRRDRWDPATDRGAVRGGRFVSVRGDDGVRYYCQNPPGFYPEVANCPNGWLRVIPDPAGPQAGPGAQSPGTQSEPGSTPAN